MGFGDHPSFSPSILYPGCLVPLFTQRLIWIILLLSFSCGAGVGVFYVNAVAVFKVKFEGPEKEFAMGYLIVAIIAGELAAALLGLYIEPVLREHCTMILNNTGLCFTRSHSSYRLSSSCHVDNGYRVEIPS